MSDYRKIKEGDLSDLFNVTVINSNTLDRDAIDRKKLDEVVYTTKITVVPKVDKQKLNDVAEIVKKKAIRQVLQLNTIGYDSLLITLEDDFIKVIKKHLLTSEDVTTIEIKTVKPVYYPKPKNALAIIGGKAYIDEKTTVKLNGCKIFEGEYKGGKKVKDKDKSKKDKKEKESKKDKKKDTEFKKRTVVDVNI